MLFFVSCHHLGDYKSSPAVTIAHCFVQEGYRRILVLKAHENQHLQVELNRLRVNSGELQACVLKIATLMDSLHEKEERALQCDAAVDGLRRIIREVKMMRTNANVELQVMATVAAGLQAVGILGHANAETR